MAHEQRGRYIPCDQSRDEVKNNPGVGDSISMKLADKSDNSLARRSVIYMIDFLHHVS